MFKQIATFLLFTLCLSCTNEKLPLEERDVYFLKSLDLDGADYDVYFHADYFGKGLLVKDDDVLKAFQDKAFYQWSNRGIRAHVGLITGLSYGETEHGYRPIASIYKDGELVEMLECHKRDCGPMLFGLIPRLNQHVRELARLGLKTKEFDADYLTPKAYIAGYDAAEAAGYILYASRERDGFDPNELNIAKVGFDLPSTWIDDIDDCYGLSPETIYKDRIEVKLEEISKDFEYVTVHTTLNHPTEGPHTCEYFKEGGFKDMFVSAYFNVDMNLNDVDEVEKKSARVFRGFADRFDVQARRYAHVLKRAGVSQGVHQGDLKDVLRSGLEVNEITSTTSLYLSWMGIAE